MKWGISDPRETSRQERGEHLLAWVKRGGVNGSIRGVEIGLRLFLGTALIVVVEQATMSKR